MWIEDLLISPCPPFVNWVIIRVIVQYMWTVSRDLRRIT